MVPVELAPPPWAKADAVNASADSTVRRPVVQRFILVLLGDDGPPGCWTVRTLSTQSATNQHQLYECRLKRRAGWKSRRTCARHSGWRDGPPPHDHDST